MLILIPCKNLNEGKSRLAACLDMRSRRALCEFFLCRTLALATSVVSAAQVRVITSDSSAAAIAAEYGASHLPDDGANLNSALSEARANLVANAIEKFDAFVLPIDLPYATSASLRMIMATQTDVVIAPDGAGTGTNALLLRWQAFQKFTFAFGERSLERHCAIARQAELTIDIIRDELLEFDVDVPNQYMRWLSSLGLSGAMPNPGVTF